MQTTLETKVKLKTEQLIVQSEIVQRRQRKKILAMALRKRYAVRISRTEAERYTEGELLLFAKARWRKRLMKEYASRWLSWYRKRKQARADVRPSAVTPSPVTSPALQSPSISCSDQVDKRLSAAITIQRVYRGYKARLRAAKLRCFCNIHKLRVMFPYELMLQREKEEKKQMLAAWVNKIAKGCKAKKCDVKTPEECNVTIKEAKIEVVKSAAILNKSARYTAKFSQSKSPRIRRRGSISPFLKQTKDTSDLLKKSELSAKNESPSTAFPTISPLSPIAWAGLVSRTRKITQEDGPKA